MRGADSWLTVGHTDGDPQMEVTSIGINFAVSIYTCLRNPLASADDWITSFSATTLRRNGKKTQG